MTQRNHTDLSFELIEQELPNAVENRRKQKLAELLAFAAVELDRKPLDNKEPLFATNEIDTYFGI